MDLTIPRAGSTAARDVLSRAMRRLATEARGLARKAYEEDARSLDALLARLANEDPGALFAALRRPPVAAPLRCMRGAEGERAEQLASQTLAELAFDLALRDALPMPVVVRTPPRFVASIGARAAATLLAPTRFASGEPTPYVDEPFTAITGQIVLATLDANPLALAEAHPDKRGNAVDLGGRTPSQWALALADALAIVAKHLPVIRAEMDLTVAQIVPVGFDAEKHESATYQEAIGTIYCSLHPSPMTLAEALVHEHSHTKLNALFEVDPVLLNADDEGHPSPLRPDPRPLRGVLLAVHAFLPIARLYEAMIERRDPLAESATFRQRFAETRELAARGAETLLARGRPTAVGAALMMEIARWSAHFT